MTSLNWKKIGICTGAALGVVVVAAVAFTQIPQFAIPATIGGVICGAAGFVGGKLWAEKQADE